MYRALYAFAASTAARASELFDCTAAMLTWNKASSLSVMALVNGVESTTKSDTGDK